MKHSGIFLLIIASLVVICVIGQNQKPKPKVGQPQFSLQGSGGGNNVRNWQAGFNAGVGTKVWESKNKDRSLELGVNYGRGFTRVDGHTFKSKPQYGIGGTYRFGKK